MVSDSKPKILLQLDTDAQTSVFDSVVAVDAGVDQLLRHDSVTPDNVRDLVYGAMFTRGPSDLHRTAIFVGGSDVPAGEGLLRKVTETFFGPLQVSVMMDSNGANTTAAAAVLAAEQHLSLRGISALVLAATGPVGSRVVRLLADQGADVRVGSRDLERADAVCQAVHSRLQSASVAPWATGTGQQLTAALDGVRLLVAAGAAGVELLGQADRQSAGQLQVAIDLNAVPPVGIAGVEVTDTGVQRGGICCYGAIGVGSTKMKIHKMAVRKLFESNDRVFDAEEIYALGRELEP